MYSEKILSLLKNKKMNLNDWFLKSYYNLNKKDTSVFKMMIEICNDNIEKYQKEIDELKNMNKEEKIKFAKNEGSYKIHIWKNRIISIGNENIPRLNDAKKFLNEKLNQTDDKYIIKIINEAINEIHESIKHCSNAIGDYSKKITEVESCSVDEIIENKIAAYQEIINRNKEDIKEELKNIESCEKYNKQNNVIKIAKEINNMFCQK